MLASNPDYWTAVAGIASAFIIAATIEIGNMSNKTYDDETAMTAGAVALGLPLILALVALGQLGNESEAPDAYATLMVGLAFGCVQLSMMFIIFGKRRKDD